MSALQKFRADIAHESFPNGGTPFYTNWMGGPTLAMVRECRMGNRDWAPRTVYATGYPDTYFSVPAACRVRGSTVRGSLMYSGENGGGLVFYALRIIGPLRQAR